MRHREFDSDCKFRYDEIRKNEDRTKTLINRCQLRDWGNRKCQYLGETHKNCPIGKGRNK